jgi:hypothetical protein
MPGTVQPLYPLDWCDVTGEDLREPTVTATGVHLACTPRLRRQRGFDRREARQGQRTRIPRSIPHGRRQSALATVQAQERRRCVRRHCRGRPSPRRTRRSAFGPYHSRAVVARLVADGDKPATQHTKPRRAVLPIACPPEVRSGSTRATRADSAPTMGCRPGILRRQRSRAGDSSSCRSADEQCVNAAVEDRLITANPVANLPVPRIERKEIRSENRPL